MDIDRFKLKLMLILGERRYIHLRNINNLGIEDELGVAKLSCFTAQCKEENDYAPLESIMDITSYQCIFFKLNTSFLFVLAHLEHILADPWLRLICFL